MQTLTITSVSTDQTEWEKQLLTYKQELLTLNKQLIEFSSRSIPKEKLALIEHFHNQFVIQNENIDILKHDMHQNTKSIAKNPEAPLTDEQLELHQQFKDQFDSEIKVYLDLKQEFADFISA
jgi:uncharacterized HAD superfamily protein